MGCFDVWTNSPKQYPTRYERTVRRIGMLILGLKGLRLSRNMSLSFFSLLWQSHRHVLFDKGDFFQFYKHKHWVFMRIMYVAKSTVSGSNVALLISHEEPFQCYLLSWADLCLYLKKGLFCKYLVSGGGEKVTKLITYGLK